MDTFFDKLGLYDFFSLIIGGMVFLCGNYLTGILDPQVIVNMQETLDSFLTLGLILLVSYLLGSCFQSIADQLFLGKYYHKLKDSILSTEESVIGNPVKLAIHRKRACEILASKGILVKEEELKKEHSSFYFGYCSYYIQTKRQHEKMEKIRGLMGLYAILIVSFFTLIVFSVIHMIFNSAQWTNQRILWGIAIYTIFMLTSCIKFKTTANSWARTVVNAYDVCYDVENGLKDE